MVSTISKPPATSQAQFVLLQNITWAQLEQLDQTLANSKARLTYLDGTLEIMAPLSDEHEEFKSTLARLVETYMSILGLRFYVRGGPTLGKSEDGTRREPDESYNVGDRKPTPDLILEIVRTSGGINVLECYARLEIPEVWFWEDGVIEVHVFQDGVYQKVNQSQLLPGLNLEKLAHHSRMADQYDAVQSYRQHLLTSQADSQS